MKHLSIQKTTRPEVYFRSPNDWRKWLIQQCKNLKQPKSNGRANR